MLVFCRECENVGKVNKIFSDYRSLRVLQWCEKYYLLSIGLCENESDFETMKEEVMELLLEFSNGLYNTATDIEKAVFGSEYFVNKEMLNAASVRLSLIEQQYKALEEAIRSNRILWTYITKDIHFLNEVEYIGLTISQMK